MQETVSASQLYNMGKNYFAIRNYEKAKEYLSGAVQKGSSKAARELMRLAQYYYKNRDGNAEECFKILAGRGSAEACLYLGRICQRGIGRKRDQDEAFSWFGQGYTLGSSEAAYEAGMMILPDVYADENARSCATEWFQAAADGGVVAAYKQLGLIHCGSGNKYMKEALQYFLRGAKEGDMDSMAYAGQIYFFGDGVEKNIPQGLALMQRAAEGKSRIACHALAKLYEDGVEVPKDTKKSREYYRLAEEYDD